jgi:ABC-type multidrug transport system fused ATPase/permease subunit
MKLQFTLVFLVTCLSSVIIILIPLLQKEIIANVLKGNLNTTNIFQFGSLAIIFTILVIFESVSLHKLYIDLKNSLEYELLAGVTKDKNTIIDKKGPGAYMVSIFGNSDQIGDLLTINYFSAITSFITSVVILIIAGRWFFIFPIIVILTYFLLALVLVICNRYYKKNFKLARDLVFDVNPKVLEFIENRNSLMANANPHEMEKEIKKLFDERDHFFKKAFIANSFAESAISAVKNLAMLFFFVIAVYYIIDEKLMISQFVAIIAYFSYVFVPISVVQKAQSGLNKFPILHERIKDNLFEKKIYNIPQNDTIRFDSVDLDYSGDLILKNLSLEVNKRIGLVGLSGEGKSSLIKLIYKDIVCTNGNIEVGMSSVDSLSKRSLLAMINYYSQDIEIYDNDLMFNITLGKKSITQSEYNRRYQLLMFSKSGNLDEAEHNNFIDYIKYLLHIKEDDSDTLLESEINTEFLAKVYLSNNFYIQEKLEKLLFDLEIEELSSRNFGQRGNKISGGEKNKIAMCRFLLNDMELPFIIDEPFTNLDVFSENNNIKILADYLKRGKGIIISHKMHVIKELSDTIVVLNEGEVYESGSHEELTKIKGFYNDIYSETSKRNK